MESTGLVGLDPSLRATRPEEEEPPEETGEPPTDDTGEVPEDTGTAAEEETGEPPVAEDSGDASGSSDLDPPPAYDDRSSDDKSKSGCTCSTHNSQRTPWLLVLIPLLLVRRSDSAQR